MTGKEAKSISKSIAIIKQNSVGRIIIYTLFLIVAIPDFIGLELPLHNWIFFVGCFTLTPYIYFLLVKYSNNPPVAEERNILIEGFFEGMLYASLAFSIMPMISIFTVSAVYVAFYGGLKLWLKGRLSMLFGALMFALIFGFNLKLESSVYTTYFSAVVLPLCVLCLVIKIKSDYELSRTKVRKNKEHLEGLSSKLAKYLSPQIYSQIFEGKKEVRLESYRKKLTIFFSDIKGFTELTDSMESESLSSLLNSYFNEMARIALKYGGTMDKYMGDGIMMFFGDPESHGEKEDALACLKMALEMRERMDVLRHGWENQGLSKELGIRMGINTGYCTVGNFGSEDRLDYTIVGGQVNLASRLESNAEVDQILISHETYALVKDHVACDKMGEIMVKGIAYPIQTYLVLDLHENLSSTNSIILQESDGFKVSIDLEKMDREKAIRSLEKIVEKIK
ncbi:MAG: adenylate cyclase [Lentimonas sp.]|jgi:adenylate cyclase